MVSATAQHALRALVHLSKATPDAPTLGRELAEHAAIAPNFLAKIMLVLRNAGFVEATRGQGGGYRLLRRPETIVLMDVVELFDGITARPGCFLGEKHPCSDEDGCSAHLHWKQVCTVYLDFLTTKTVADIGHAYTTSPLSSLTVSGG